MIITPRPPHRHPQPPERLNIPLTLSLMVCLTLSPAEYTASVIEKKLAFMISPMPSFLSMISLRICLWHESSRGSALTLSHSRSTAWRASLGPHLYRMDSASAFFLSSAWPLEAPVRRICARGCNCRAHQALHGPSRGLHAFAVLSPRAFICPSTVTVGATTYLADPPDILLGTWGG